MMASPSKRRPPCLPMTTRLNCLTKSIPRKKDDTTPLDSPFKAGYYWSRSSLGAKTFGSFRLGWRKDNGKNSMKNTTDKSLEPSKYARVVPKKDRHRVSKDAQEPRNIKVRVSIYLDLDVLNHFKALAAEPGTPPYQTQINAALRAIVDNPSAPDIDPSRQLRQAKSLIDAVLRTM